MMRPKGGEEQDGTQILLAREDNPCRALYSNKTITSSSTGSRALFPSSPRLTVSSKSPVVQNKPEGELEPSARLVSYRAG